MLSRLGSILLSDTPKRRVKTALWQARAAYVKRFRSYDAGQLVSALCELGVVPGDVIIVHSSYSPLNGFRGPPARIVAAFQQAIGPDGTLLMPSSPYTDSTEEYARTGEPFDVCRTVSRMGLLSEMFRRQQGTRRSLNPAHPVLAHGPLASWFVEGHESCAYSCGPGSPFEKMAETDARALFFDVGLTHLMFFHYLEHSVSDALPFPLYNAEGHEVRVIDENGRERPISVRSFSQRARTARRFSVLEGELRKHGMVRDRSIGNTSLSLVRIRDTVTVTRDMASRGKYFYEFRRRGTRRGMLG